MSTVPTPRYTPQEYLELERKAQTKSEFYRGEIFAMSGASKEHNAIAANVLALIWNQFRGRPCQVYGSDMRVKVDWSGLYTYPDVSALCGEAEFDDEHVDTLLNPQVLVEVLSPSTEDYDRGGKFELYRQLPSLRDYVVVAQDRIFVEHHTRQDDGSWRLVDFRDKSDEIAIEGIDCRLRLEDVYDKVSFDLPQRGAVEETSN